MVIIENISTLTLLNGRTLTATLTQSLLCMSETLALMVQQASIDTGRPTDQLPHSEQHNAVSSYTVTWAQSGLCDRNAGVHFNLFNWKHGSVC